jgi:3',5'-nucleoside bisphosphate phosphatase
VLARWRRARPRGDLSILIDLHLHTTASDGRSTPRQLVDLAAAAGLSVMAATDHDTTAAIDEVQAAAAERGITAIPGIEITAVRDGVDVHMLGYFFDAANERLRTFLATQRATRVRRAQAIADRLGQLGLPIDVEPVLRRAREHPNESIGRPQIARAMIAAGHVTDVREAFDRWLGRGCPAFMERTGMSPAVVIEIVHGAGGIVSMAHPGRTNMDDLIEPLAASGLDAIEIYHSDHDAAAVERYRATADRLGLLATGGSDFHADPARAIAPGTTTLPQAEWERLQAARPRHG